MSDSQPTIAISNITCIMKGCQWGVAVPRFPDGGQVESYRYRDELMNQHLRNEHGLMSVLIAQHEKQVAADESFSRGLTAGKQELSKVVRQAFKEAMLDIVRDAALEED